MSTKLFLVPCPTDAETLMKIYPYDFRDDANIPEFPRKQYKWFLNPSEDRYETSSICSKL